MGLTALWGAAGCSGTIIRPGEGDSGGSAGAATAGGSSTALPGAAGAGAGASSSADAGASSGGAAGTSPSPGSGTCEECVLLLPSDGWVDGNSNRLMINGALVAFADEHSRMKMTTDFTGTNACLAGSTAQALTPRCKPSDTECYDEFWGAAIGLNLNQTFDVMTMTTSAAPFDASSLAGFAFDLVGNRLPSPQDLMFQVFTENRAFCSTSSKKLTLGSNTMLFSDLLSECLSDPRDPDLRPTAETVKSSLIRISWFVLSNTSSEVPYDFCVANLRALLK